MRRNLYYVGLSTYLVEVDDGEIRAILHHEKIYVANLFDLETRLTRRAFLVGPFGKVSIRRLGIAYAISSSPSPT